MFRVLSWCAPRAAEGKEALRASFKSLWEKPIRCHRCALINDPEFVEFFHCFIDKDDKKMEITDIKRDDAGIRVSGRY